ncbi:hypothetical protein YC2023_097744 [Brassica napus]
MRRSRSPFHPGGSRKLTRSDLSERPLQVAPEAQSDLARVTPRGRSHFYRMTTTQWSQSDLSQRHSEVAPEAWSDYSERRAEVARIFITRERENESGATSRSDTARSLPKCGATTRSDERSHQEAGLSFVLKKTTKNLEKGDLFDSLITCSTSLLRIVSRLKVDSLIDHLPSLVRYLITQGLIPMPMSSIFP